MQQLLRKKLQTVTEVFCKIKVLEYWFINTQDIFRINILEGILLFALIFSVSVNSSRHTKETTFETLKNNHY